MNSIHTIISTCRVVYNSLVILDGQSVTLVLATGSSLISHLPPARASLGIKLMRRQRPPEAQKFSFCDHGIFVCPGKSHMAYIRGLCGGSALQKWARVLPDDFPVNHLARERPHGHISTCRKLAIMVSSVPSPTGS